MEWRPEYATGVERIDEQHRMLFRMAADFRAALDEGRGERVYGDLLESLGLYTRTHFGFEDRCMVEYRCPVAGANQAAHAAFSGVLASFQRRYASRGFHPGEAREMVDTLGRWLTDHVARVDAQLRRSVEGFGQR